MTYVEKLDELLFGSQAKKLVNFSVTWGPNAPDDPELRAKAIYEAMTDPGEIVENIDEWNAT